MRDYSAVFEPGSFNTETERWEIICKICGWKGSYKLERSMHQEATKHMNRYHHPDQ